jgi:hypothetical protein
MSGCKTAKGYFQVALHGKSVRVNRIIATAFVENPNNLPESQHIDGNRENNTADNLKWGEPKENANDRSRHGRTVVGSRSPNAKLSEALVLKIRALRPIKTLQSLADEFGVSKKLVLLVTQNKAWRHA